MRAARLLTTAALLVIASISIRGAHSAPPPRRIVTPILHAAPRFEPNVGQFPAGVRFASRSRLHVLQIRDRGATLTLRNGAASSAVTMEWGRKPAGVAAVDPLPGVSHYLTGRNPQAWRRNVPGYARVRYTRVAPGIDLEFYGAQRGFEYDVVVAPRADLARFALHIAGAQDLSVDAGGDLVLRTAAGVVRQRTPIAYQQIAGRRQPVHVSYDLRGATVRLRAERYDRERPLVIDPIVEFQTYLGGSGDDVANATAFDAAGNVYVAGTTTSADFPVAAAFATDMPFHDAFVSKFSPDGSTLIYSTYLGGSNVDTASGLAVTPGGGVYVTGATISTDFPVVNAAQPSNTEQSSYVARLNESGSGFVFATYLGGNGIDNAFAIAIDPAGSAYVTGVTRSSNFPLLNPFQTTPGSGFITKYTGDGSVVYSTYFGGPSGGSFGTTGFGVVLRAIAADASGNAYVAGEATGAVSPTTAGAFQPTPGPARCTGIITPSVPCSDAVVAKLSPTGQLVYGTYLRETAGAPDGRNDGATGIAVDSIGSAYVTGYTQSASFPTTAGAFRTTCLTPECGDASFFDANSERGEIFVTRLNPAGSGLLYSTLLGGLQGQAGGGIAVDNLGIAVITGSTASTDFPLVNAAQAVLGSSSVLRSTNSGATFTSLNGPLGRRVTRIAVAIDGTRYAVGRFNTRIAGIGDTTVDQLFKSTTGDQWTRLAVPGAGLADLTTDPNNANILYIAGFKSVDAGTTWTALAPLPDGTSSPVPQVRTGDSNVLYAAGSLAHTIFKSTNAGAAWAPVGAGLPNDTGLSFALARSAPDTIYAWQFASGAPIFVSVNGGDSWTARTAPAGDPNALIQSVQVDPFDAATLYVATDRGFDKSTDGGATWRTTLAYVRSVGVLSVGLTTPTTIYLPFSDLPGTVLLGSLQRSIDGGETWTVVNARAALEATPNPANPAEVFVAAQANDDAFVTALSADGSSILYSSFIGGLNEDKGFGIAAARDGAIAVAGQTLSTNLPVVAPVQGANAGALDGFVSKLRYPRPLIDLDQPHDGAVLDEPFRISGWALDRGSAADCGIDGVHIWAFPSAGTPRLLAAPVPSVARADVAAVFGPQFGTCGFTADITGLPADTYTFALYPHSTVTGTFAAPRVITNLQIRRRALVIVDSPSPGGTLFGTSTLSGWALDTAAAAGSGIDAIHVWAYPNIGSGAAPIFAGVATLGVSRPDVGAIFGAPFDHAGYQLTLPGLAPGDYLFAVYPHSTISGQFDAPATVRATIVPSVLMSVDTPRAGDTIAAGSNLGGWAIDRAPGTGPGIDAVHVWAYPNPGSGQAPVFVGAAAFGSSRPDVGGIFGGRFTNSGFNLAIPTLPPGTYLLAVFPHSALTGQFAPPTTLVVTVSGGSND